VYLCGPQILFLEKATWYLVIALFVLCMLSASFSASTKFENEDPAIEQEAPAEGQQP